MEENNLSDGLLTLFLISPYFEENNISLVIHSNCTVYQLKQKLITTRNLQNKSIRLIYCGRTLQDYLTLNNAGLSDQSRVHCFITEFRQEQDEEQEEEQPPRGFDRLREMGFSEEEIEHYRMEFYANREYDEDDVNEDLIALEDQWISNYISPQEIVDQRIVEQQEMRNEGDYQDLFLGMVCGFLLGLLLSIWLYDTSTTRKTKYGVVIGIICNIAFGLLKLTMSPS